MIKNPELYSIAKSLTLKERHSGMRILLRHWKYIDYRHIDAKAIFLYLRNKSYGKKIVGWCLCTHENDEKFFTKKYGYASFQVFVNPVYRGRGYGTRLLKKARQVFPEDILEVYSSDSPDFFTKHLKGGYCVDVLRRHQLQSVERKMRP